MDLKKLAEQAAQIAKEAGKLVLHENHPDIFDKAGHNNYVTSMDFASQQYIIEHLAPLIPGAEMLAEEKDNAVEKSQYRWVIDPIDGTTNYMKHFGHSCVSIALAKDGEGLLGAVYDIFRDDLFLGIRGQGATLNDRPIHISDTEMEEGLIIFGTAPYYEEMRQQTYKLVGEIGMQCGDVRRTGAAALDICFVAAGKADGFYELYLQPWDYAAGLVILKEAGGQFESLNGPGFDFLSPNGICCGNPKVFPELRQFLERHGVL